MHLSEVQAELRAFLAQRDERATHAPSNLSTALMVEAAKLAEIFQWCTPEASRHVHEDAAVKDRIGDQLANVLMYLTQLSEDCQIDLPQAVRRSLAKASAEYRQVLLTAEHTSTESARPGTHVLLDYENVQPTDAELRAMIPEVGSVWVFHGPHQRDVAHRFASFGTHMTAVPISKTGKNALDFHLSFYMGYIASRSPNSTMVVIANDKGYEPMLEHARAMGFDVRRQSYGPAKSPAKKAAAKKVASKKSAAKQVVTKNSAAKPAAAKQVAATQASAKAAPVKKAAPAKKTAPAKKSAVKEKVPAPPAKVAVKQPAAASKPKPAALDPDSAATQKKLKDSLRKMGAKRPAKLASLRRLLKSFQGEDGTEPWVDSALAGLVKGGVVIVDSVKRTAAYPGLDAPTGLTPS